MNKTFDVLLQFVGIEFLTTKTFGKDIQCLEAVALEQQVLLKFWFSAPENSIERFVSTEWSCQLAHKP